MPFTWFVALRYMSDARGQTALMLAASSLGVSVVVFLSALISGLQASLIEKTLGLQPHVTIGVPDEEPRALVEPDAQRGIARIVQSVSQRLRSIDQWPRVVAEIERSAAVTAVSPTVSGAGFAARADARVPIIVRGIEPERFCAVIPVHLRLVDGKLDVVGSHVVIGAALAADLGAGVGDKLRISSLQGVSGVVTVAGIFSFGNAAIDEAWVLTSLRSAQSLLRLPGGASSLELKVADVFAAERVAAELRERTGLTVKSWMTRNSELLAGLSAQEASKNMIQLFVVLAVALGIASVLVVSVLQKSREIGILRAVGTPRERVLGVFLVQGGLLGLGSSLFGSALGAAFATLFEQLARGEDGAPRFPVQLTPALFVGASVLATGVGLLAAVIPARRAARLDPATAIRSV